MRNIAITADKVQKEDLNGSPKVQAYCLNPDSQDAYLLTAANQVLLSGDSGYEVSSEADDSAYSKPKLHSSSR